MIRLEDPNNFGCKLRDLIWANFDKFKVNGTISMSLIKKRLDRIEIPKQYWSHILAMTDYRKFDRIKDPIEQLIEGRVLAGILNEILEEDYALKPHATSNSNN